MHCCLWASAALVTFVAVAVAPVGASLHVADQVAEIQSKVCWLTQTSRQDSIEQVDEDTAAT